MDCRPNDTYEAPWWRGSTCRGNYLDFALLQSNKGLDDPETKLHYSNMFDVLVDAMHTAMVALNYSDIGIVVTETGWPSKGDANETVASIDNAAIYNNNIIRHILNRTGTPMRPGVEVSTYIYELFNEDKRRGALYQQNWGLFEPNGTQAYGVKTLDTGQKSAVKAAARTWCVGRPWVSSDILLAALNWACGPGGAECGPIQLGEPCFVPNTVLSHASYAFNSYYQIHEHALGSCDFGGTAILTTEDPSYPGCSYPFRPGQVGAPIIGSSTRRFEAQTALVLCVVSVWLHASLHWVPF